jgi:hypothetical protein
MGNGGSGSGRRRGRVRVGTVRRVDAVAVDGEATLDAPEYFAPGAENCPITYEFRRGPSLQGATVSLTIKDRDNRTVHNSGVLGLGGDRRNTFQWDGQDDAGALVTPQKSPYTLTLRVGNAITRTRQVRVELHSIDIWTRTTNRRIDMSNADQTLDTAATVKIRRTNGAAAPAQMAMQVKFSFEAGGSNTSSADSFQYNTASHRRLGKGGDATAVYWEAHSRCTAASDDSYRQTCRVQILTTGADRGKAFVKFKPSGVGGDTYRIIATVYWADGTTVMRRERGPELTVWRKIHFSSIYTMNGETYIDNATTEPEIDPAFEPSGYVMYSRGGITTLSDALSPDYIGLYVSGGGAKTWPADLSPQSLETSAFQLRPTADELSQYAYTGTDAARLTQKNNAKTAIERKAALWFDAVVREYGSACDAWFADAGVPSNRNVILAVKYYHPKLSGRPDGATNFWPAGIQINLANPGSGLRWMGDPDQTTWRNVHGFNRGSISVIFKNYDTPGNLQITCRHEIGHGTKSAFKRDTFGTGDHSASALMTPSGASNVFSNADILILRGYHR